MSVQPHASDAVLPRHLDSDAAQGFVPGETIAQFELGTMRNFIYLVLDPSTRKAVIVDPQKDVETPLRALAENGYELVACLLTHSHHDHVAGVGPLLERMPGLPIHVHEGDLHRLGKWPKERFRIVRDGDVLRVGTVEIEALHSPGHSAGELCYLVKAGQGFLLTGDTLFIRDCGRTDFPDGSDDEMFATLQRLKRLPDSLVVLPGHHYAREVASLLGDEKRRSPPLLCRSVDELRNLP
jgi:glyoxylase-like metal-dependent hydrolase (beta-lactamase superfamily II)